MLTGRTYFSLSATGSAKVKLSPIERWTPGAPHNPVYALDQVPALNAHVSFRGEKSGPFPPKSTTSVLFES